MGALIFAGYAFAALQIAEQNYRTARREISDAMSDSTVDLREASRKTKLFRGDERRNIPMNGHASSIKFSGLLRRGTRDLEPVPFRHQPTDESVALLGRCRLLAAQCSCGSFKLVIGAEFDQRARRHLRIDATPSELVGDSSSTVPLGYPASNPGCCEPFVIQQTQIGKTPSDRLPDLSRIPIIRETFVHLVMRSITIAEES